MERTVIVDLQDTPEFIPTIAAWHQSEWAALNPGETLEQRIAREADPDRRRGLELALELATAGANPALTGIDARRATVTPASPTTLVNAPRPTIFAPRCAASRTAASRRA